jgi:hypothetical protein
MISKYDGEVIRLSEKGTVIEWDDEAQASYDTGEALADWGIHNLTKKEASAIGISAEQLAKAVKIFEARGYGATLSEIDETLRTQDLEEEEPDETDLGYAIIYDYNESGTEHGALEENYYEVFETPEEARRVWKTFSKGIEHKLSNVRLVQILGPIDDETLR